MPSTATSCVAANALTRTGRHQGNQGRVRAERNEGQSDQRQGQTRLRHEDPGPPETHRWKLEPIHERAAEQLDGPGKGHDGAHQGHIANAEAEFGETRRDRDRQKPKRHALREIARREEGEAQPAPFAQGRFHDVKRQP